MKNLYTTKQVPTQAAILLVDVEEKQFAETLEGHDEDTATIVKGRYQEALGKMKEKLIHLKSLGHKIYATAGKEGLYPGFESIPDQLLPEWFQGYSNHPSVIESNILHPTIIEELKSEEILLVCGLWLELCELVVTMKLREHGINSFLSLDEDLSLRNRIMWTDDDVVTLESSCKEYDINIIEVEEKN